MSVYKSLVLFNFRFMYKMYNWKGDDDSSNVRMLSCNCKESFRSVMWCSS